MHNIEIDDEIFEYLKARTVRIGEPASEILRRELRIGSKPTDRVTQAIPGTSANRTPRTGLSSQAKALADFLETSEFLVQPNVLGRFLCILSWLLKRDPKAFELVFRLFGRKRKYFGKTRSELEQFGSSVMPQQIPGTTTWVVTNTSTATKKTIMQKVMVVMKYDSEAVELALSALR